MANSINTNRGALVALQNLNATNRDLNVTQNRINTGKIVSSAKDNGAIFAIATNQRAELSALDSVKQSIQRGQSVVDVALAAGETIVEALTEMKKLATAIEAGGSSATTTALQADFDALQTEIDTALANANFDGANLFTATAVSVKIGTGAATSDSKSLGGTAITVEPTDATAASVQTAKIGRAHV